MRIRALFAAAYPGTAPDALHFGHAADALAAYQSVAFAATRTPWDDWLRNAER